jgi:hydroxymethylpyrimidine/phosphomethylpyrimidine kinase
VVKGGHLAGEAVDILFDGHDFHLLHAERIASPHTHGTGCTFSAAITAGLARGLQLTQAVTEAKAFVTEAIRHGYAIGSGTSPVNQFFPNAG